VSSNIGSTAATWRIPASVVCHWVIALPVLLDRRWLPIPEDFPEGVVAP